MVWLALIAGVFSIATHAGATENPAKIENFSLRDYRGKMHQLTDLADSKCVVVAFVGCDCPIAKLVGPKLARLAAEFESQGVAFLAIDANSQDSLSQLGQFARAHEIKFPVVKDLGNVVADQFGAERTPEVFLLDQERKVRYHGRVDDQYLVGRNRPQPTRARPETGPRRAPGRQAGERSADRGRGVPHRPDPAPRQRRVGRRAGGDLLQTHCPRVSGPLRLLSP